VCQASALPLSYDPK